MMVHNRLAGTAMGSAEKNVSVALGLKKKRESYMRGGLRSNLHVRAKRQKIN
jgi:hypothetical protein